MPTGPARSGRPDDKLRMVEGACSEEEFLAAVRPFHRACARSPFPALRGRMNQLNAAL
jgi:hypothetical protein